jgi:CheY-like chemotaxis protein
MVYGVAKQSGGEARIDTRPGEGTTVTVTLRRVSGGDAGAASETPAAGQGADSSGGGGGGGRTVLIVDDDDDVRTTLRFALEALDYAVVEAVDGPSALALLREGRPDLAIIDFAMPGMNGAEVAREARRLHPGLPLLFASGYADTKALQDALGSEMPLLRKPFEVSELAATVARGIAAAPRD